MLLKAHIQLCAFVFIALSACGAKPSAKPVQLIYFYGGMAERVQAAWITPDFFKEHTGTKPLFGRLFQSQEYKTDPTAVMLSATAFDKRFHSDPAVIGQGVNLAGAMFTVVGVLPANFTTPGQAEFLLPKDTLP